jgi:site-specific recombinase XerD
MLPLKNHFPSGENASEAQESATSSTETRTESGQDKRTKRGQKPLPRGIRVRMMTDGRKHPALLFVRGKVKEAFETEAQAITAGRELAEKEREFGREVRAFDPREWRRYIEAKELYFGGREPDWPSLAARPAASTITVGEAVAKYVALRAGDGLAAGTSYQLKTKLGRLVAAFGERQLAGVSSAELRAWLAGLDFAPWTVKDHLKVASTFWTAARREKWTLEDPTEGVKGPKIEAEEVNVLSLAEGKKLFAANRGLPVVGRLALEAFGGLRCSSAGRLTLPDLKWPGRGIELPGRRHKSGRRHYIDGLPPNLWRWLKAAPAGCWTMTERQYATEKAAAFIRAGVASTHNCLRHSFCTYHVAAGKDAAATAVLMQHTSPSTLYKFYKGKATAADGRAWFRISP